jgi:hypothetical protein
MRAAEPGDVLAEEVLDMHTKAGGGRPCSQNRAVARGFSRRRFHKYSPRQRGTIKLINKKKEKNKTKKDKMIKEYKI